MFAEDFYPFYRKTITFLCEAAFRDAGSLQCCVFVKIGENIAAEAEMEIKRQEKTYMRRERRRRTKPCSSLPLIRYLSSPSRRICKNREPVAVPGSSIILYRRYEVSTDEVAGRAQRKCKARTGSRGARLDPLPVLLGPP